MNIQQIRQQYPQYANISDAELARLLRQRFYPQLDQEDFNRRIGLKPDRTLGGYARETLKAIPAGAVNMLESAAIGASALLPEGPEEAARRGIERVAGAARRPFEADAAYADTMPVKIGAGVGSTLPFLAAGPFGLAGRAAAVGLGVSAGAGEARTRAEDEGATDEQRATATALGTIPGALEVFAPFRILDRIPTASKAQGMALVRRALLAGGEEAAQEAASNWAQNLIAQQVYKPDQELIEGLGEAATIGGATGALIQGIMDLAVGGRRGGRGTPAPEETPPAEELPAAEEGGSSLAQPPATPPAPQQIYDELERLRGPDLNDQEGQIVALQEQMLQAQQDGDIEGLAQISEQVLALQTRARELEKQLPKNFVPEHRAEQEVDKLLRALEKAAEQGDAAAVRRITARLQSLDATTRLRERRERAQRDEDLRAQTVGPAAEQDPYLTALEDAEEVFDDVAVRRELGDRSTDLEAQTVGPAAEQDPYLQAVEEANEQTTERWMQRGLATADQQPRLFPDGEPSARVTAGMSAPMPRSAAMIQAELTIARAARDRQRVTALAEELRDLRARQRTREEQLSSRDAPASETTNRELDRALGINLPQDVARRQAATDQRYRSFAQFTSLLERFNRGALARGELETAQKNILDAIEAEIRLLNPDAGAAEVNAAQREARELLNDLRQRWGDTRNVINTGTREEPQLESPQTFGGQFRNDLNDPGPTGFGLPNIESRAPGDATLENRFAAAESVMGGIDAILARAAGRQPAIAGTDTLSNITPAQALEQDLSRIEQSPRLMQDPGVAAVVQRLRAMQPTLNNPDDLQDARDYLRENILGGSAQPDTDRRVSERERLLEEGRRSDDAPQGDMFPDTGLQGRVFDSFEDFDRFLASDAVASMRQQMGKAADNLSRAAQRAAPLRAKAEQLEKKARELAAQVTALRSAAADKVAEKTRQLQQQQAVLAREQEQLVADMAPFERALTDAQIALRDAHAQRAELSAALDANLKRLLAATNTGVVRGRENDARIEQARQRAEALKRELQAWVGLTADAEQTLMRDYEGVVGDTWETGVDLTDYMARKEHIWYMQGKARDAHDALATAMRSIDPSATPRLDGFKAYVSQQQALQKQMQSLVGRIGALTAIRNRAQKARDAAQAFQDSDPGTQRAVSRAEDAVAVARSLQSDAQAAQRVLEADMVADLNKQQSVINQKARVLRQAADALVDAARPQVAVRQQTPEEREASAKRPVQPDEAGQRRIAEQRRLEQREYPTAPDGTPVPRAVVDFKMLRDKLDAYQEAPQRIQELLSILNNPTMALADRVRAATAIVPADIKRFSDLALGQYLEGADANAPLFNEIPVEGPTPPQQTREQAVAELQARQKQVEDKLAGRLRRIDRLIEVLLGRMQDAGKLKAEIDALTPADFLNQKEAAKVATARKRRGADAANALTAELGTPKMEQRRKKLQKELDEALATIARVDKELLKARGGRRTELPSREEAQRQREALLRPNRRELSQEERDAIAEKRRRRAAGESTNLGADAATEEIANIALGQTQARTSSPLTRAETQRGGFRTGVPETADQRKGGKTAQLVESKRPAQRDTPLSAAEMRAANKAAADIEAQIEAAQIAAANAARAEARRQAKLDAADKKKQADSARKQAEKETASKARKPKATTASLKRQKAFENDGYDQDFDAVDSVDGIDTDFTQAPDANTDRRLPETSDAVFDPDTYLEDYATAVDTEAPFNGMTFAEAARWGGKNAPNAMQRFLFNRLAQVLDVVPAGTTAGRVFALARPMYTFSGGKATGAAAGRYLTRPNVVFSVSSTTNAGASPFNTLLHELTHAATSRALIRSQQLFSRVNKLRRQAKAWLETDTGRQYLKDHPGLTKITGRVYGNENPHEFVAELYGNPEFQRMLAQIPASTPGRSVLSRFVKAVANYFGLDTKQQQTLLAQAMALSEDVFSYTRNEIYKDGNTQGYQDVAFNAPSPEFSPSIPEKVQRIATSDVAYEKPWYQRLAANVSGLAFRTQFLDRLAPVEELIRQGAEKGTISSLRAFQANYFLRFGEQRNQFVQTSAIQGVPQLRKNADGEFMFETPPGEQANLRKIGEALSESGLGNEQATEMMFTKWLSFLRADQVGYDKLNYKKDPKVLQAEAKELKAFVQSNPQVRDAFEKARKMYRQYNNDLLDLMGQTGVLSAEQIKTFKQGDYVPYYRNTNGVIELIVAGEKPVRVGDLTTQPELDELVGGEESILPFFSGAMQNTQLLMNMALRNQQTRDIAYLLQELGALKRHGKAPPIMEGTGTGKQPNKLQFKEKGALKHVVIDPAAIEAFGVPPELLVQGLQGIKTTLPAALRILQAPADWLRMFITRAPAYAIRQIVREPINAFLVSGANFVPVASSVNELGKILANKSTAATKLELTGAISSNVITGDIQDQSRMLRDLSQDKNAWTKIMSAADRFAIQGDTATRAVLYDKFRKQGMTHMQATLGALEVMNFGRRGLSPSMQMMSMLIPFFNAQVQGIDVIYRAMTGKTTFNDKLDVQRKLYTRGAMIAAATMAYALAMQDDEAYKNATPQERALSWFLPLPGTDEKLRIPIPFELGYMFKALPELLVNTAYGDTTAREALKAVGSLAYNTVPIGMPQAIKPMVEVVTNYSFFTGAPVEGPRDRLVRTEERFRDNTTEAAKLLGQAGVLSPVQIDYLIRGYTGGLGIALLSLSNFAVRPLNGESLPEGASRTLNQMPFLGPLFQPADGRRALDSAYQEMQGWQEAQQTLQRMVQQGRRSEAMAFAQKYSRDIALASSGGAFRQQMGELAALRRAIVADPGLSPSEKRERVDRVRQIEIALARQIREIGRQSE